MFEGFLQKFEAKRNENTSKYVTLSTLHDSCFRVFIFISFSILNPKMLKFDFFQK